MVSAHLSSIRYLNIGEFMNFNSASFCLLTVSLLAQSPELWAAKKSKSETIKEIQSAVLKNKKGPITGPFFMS